MTHTLPAAPVSGSARPALCPPHSGRTLQGGLISDRVEALNSQRGDAAEGGPIGRRGELAAIQAFVQRTRGDGEALIVVGEPGVGKTLLLDVAANTARSTGASVLRALPHAGEKLLPIDGGLRQAHLPVLVQKRHYDLSAPPLEPDSLACQPVSTIRMDNFHYP
jgi:hypothetical protein